jgi:allantoate deiminase
VSSADGIGREIMSRIELLAAASESDTALTRRYLTPEHRKANDLLGAWMASADMNVRVDAVGNIVGRYDGTDPGMPALLIGSHTDTVRDAGKYDGILGVLVGISAVDALYRAGERMPYAIEVIGFGDEEGVRYDSTFLGSRGIAGTLDPSLLDRIDGDGISMGRALRDFGLDPARVTDAARRADDVLAYVEVHIEQGPVLERENLPVGVVTSIAGQSRLRLSLLGTAGHAGTVPMQYRRDALVPAAEIVRFVESTCSAEPGLVGTVGTLEVQPGAVNVIPGRVDLTVDVRAPADAARTAAVDTIMSGATDIASRREVGIEIERFHDTRSCACDEGLSRQLAEAVETHELPVRYLPSGAGHDAMAMADLAPVAMLFVRCAGGVSHNPVESITAEDAATSAEVLLSFIRSFSPAS